MYKRQTLYVYDSSIIKRQIDRLKNAFHVPELGIHFACKALNNINILKLIRQWGVGIDTVSVQEIWTGLKAGFKASEIIYTPNCVAPDEVEMAIQLGVQINIDHIETLEYIGCLLYTSPSPRDRTRSRMPSSA